MSLRINPIVDMQNFAYRANKTSLLFCVLRRKILRLYIIYWHFADIHIKKAAWL